MKLTPVYDAYVLSIATIFQAPKSIIAQAQLKKQVPVHTISFNCTDTQANQFLYSLARSTNGRYHWFSESGVPSDGVEAWQVSYYLISSATSYV